MLLALACQQLESKEFQRLHKYLKQQFPPALSLSSSSAAASASASASSASASASSAAASAAAASLSALDHGMTDVLHKARDCTQMLLQRFVEAHGALLSALIRTHFVPSASASASTSGEDTKSGSGDWVQRLPAPFVRCADYAQRLLKHVWEVECELAEFFPPVSGTTSLPIPFPLLFCFFSLHILHSV